MQDGGMIAVEPPADLGSTEPIRVQTAHDGLSGASNRRNP
jgi:hypothetical protein